MTQDRMYIRLATLLMLTAGLYVMNVEGAQREINLIRTNAVDRWITNVIDVHVPANHFINEYRTNVVTVFRTNQVNSYKTNLVSLYWTNLITRHLTNTIPVQLFETNLVTTYRTNIRALTLTNWETVLVLKTNYIFSPVTNVVEVDVPARHASSIASVPQSSVQPAVAYSSQSTEPLQIEAVRVRGGSNNRVQVKLSIKPTLAGSSPVQVQQWRVESEDGSILSFGQEREFNRELPVGRYKVEVKTGRDSSRPVTTRRTLSVTVTAAVIDSKPLARN